MCIRLLQMALNDKFVPKAKKLKNKKSAVNTHPRKTNFTSKKTQVSRFENNSYLFLA